MLDYYVILNIKRGASQEEIKKAYHFLLRKYHPDNAGAGARDMFEKVREAHAVLSDPEKKEEYDKRLRTAGREKGKTGKYKKVDNYFGKAAGTLEPEKINRFFDSFTDGENPESPERYRSLFNSAKDDVSPAEKIFWTGNSRKKR